MTRQTYRVPAVKRSIESPALRAALAWVARGARVLPCLPHSKVPDAACAPRGVLDASNDVEKVLEWFGNGARRNIGLRLDRMLALDIEGPGHGVDGRDAYSHLCEREVVPEGLWSQSTPSGGMHVVGTLPEGITLPRQSGELAPGVEWRTGHAYIVVSPSDFCGDNYDGVYREFGDGDPTIEMPIALVELCRRSCARKQAPAVAAEGQSEIIPGGGRNKTLTSLAGTMRRRGMGVEEIEAALLAANRLRCKPPLPEAEVVRIASSVHRYTPDSVRQREPPTDEAPLVAHRISLVEVWSAPLPETPWAIPGYMVQRDRIVLGGARKGGKSTLLADLALALSTGQDWLGLPLPGGPTRVVLADEEQGDVLARQRLRRLMAGRAFDDNTARLAAGNLRYLHRNRLNLDRAARLDLLDRELSEHGAAWLLFDSLKRMHARDESSNTELSSFFEGVLDPLLERTGAGLVMLHHSRKGEHDEDGIVDAIRGAGDITAWVDTIWGLLRDGDARKLVVCLGRWDDTAHAVRVRKTDLPGGAFRLEGENVRNQAADLIRSKLAVARQEGAMRNALGAALRDELGLSPDTADKSLTRELGGLYRNGDVSKSGNTHGVRYWLREHAPPHADNALGV